MGESLDCTLRQGEDLKEATEEHQAPEAAALSILAQRTAQHQGITDFLEETGEFGRREEGAWCCMGTSRPWFCLNSKTLVTLLFFFEPQSSHPSTGGVDQSVIFAQVFSSCV